MLPRGLGSLTLETAVSVAAVITADAVLMMVMMDVLHQAVGDALSMREVASNVGAG